MNTTVPEGYKKTKVGIIPEDWIEKKAGDLFINISNKKHNGEFEILAATQDKGVIPRSMLDMDIKTSEESINSYKLIEIGNFIISLRSFQGGIEYSYYKGLVSPAYTVLKENEPINRDFYKYLFKKEDFIKKLNSLIFGIRDGKQISYSDFSTMYLQYPPLIQQNKIAQILTTWDEVIVKQEKLIKEKEQLKKGLIQKLLSGEVRFNGFNDEWQEIKLKDILIEHGTKSDGKCEVHSVSVAKGLINQIEHLGRSYAAEDTSNYNLVKPFDIVYTKSPTGNFPYGIVKQNLNSYSGIVSPLYGVFTPKNEFIGYILHLFFESPIRTGNYLRPIVQKGAKNTMSITNKTFLSKSIKLPRNEEEQEKIVQLLKEMTKEVELLQQELKELKLQKKALMQKLLTGQVRVKV